MRRSHEWHRLADRLIGLSAGTGTLDDFIDRLLANGVLLDSEADRLRHEAEPSDDPVAAARKFLLSERGNDSLTFLWRHAPAAAAAEAARSPEADPEPARRLDPLRLELEARKDQLLPGAVELLAGRWADLAKLPPDQLAREIAKRFGPDGLGRKFLDPSAGTQAQEHPVKAALNRYAKAGLIPESSVGLLWNQWAAEYAGFDEPAAAAAIRKRLGEWSNRNYVAAPYRPAMPPDVAKAHKLLQAHFQAEAGSVGQAEALAERHRDLGRWSDEAGAVKALALRLRLDQDDPRHKAAAVGTGISYGLDDGAEAREPAWSSGLPEPLRAEFDKITGVM